MWLMMSLARSTCPLISTDSSESVSGAMGSLRRVLRRKQLAAPSMTVSGWFSSWATPVAISPSVAIFPA